MKFAVRHEIKGRIRIHICGKRMSCRDADILQYYLDGLEGVYKAGIYPRTQDAVICYHGKREQIIDALQKYSKDTTAVPEHVLENSGRAMNEQFKEKLMTMAALRAAHNLLLPYPVRFAITAVKSVRYIRRGIASLLKRKIEVPVLDAAAIGVSMARADIRTAGSVMFLLGVGEILEEWTHKKSVNDLARSMSLRSEKVWFVKPDGQEILVDSSEIRPKDLVRVRMGNVIPFDGEVVQGEAMVNQTSLTGEPQPVCKSTGGYVYAGTALEEGELTLCVRETAGSSRYEKIVGMIEDSEKLKSSLEGKAEHLADRLVPYTLAGTVLTYLLTRNVAKALSVLMVDFSCALKLAMPISVLSAIREAGTYGITVKGGKYMEAMAEARTIVFDKTGTLTKAKPVVAEVIPFNDMEPDELLRIAACIEEHFPHSMARAVVNAAKAKGLVHEEMHSRVEYTVAHGISTTIGGRRILIGSWHFLMEDEHCTVPEGMEERFAGLPGEYSHLYLAIEGKLAAVICVEDPLREEAAYTVNALKEAGLEKTVMMTGDSERTACVIAGKVGVDEYYSEVLPEDKAAYVKRQKGSGQKVIMIGDGINDSLALSSADVGIAISDGAEIAREIADVTIAADNLHEIVTLKQISNQLMKRISRNYRTIVGVNGGLILLGVCGLIRPTASAMLHNLSTLAISLKSMENLLPHSKENTGAESY